MYARCQDTGRPKEALPLEQCSGVEVSGMRVLERLNSEHLRVPRAIFPGFLLWSDW